ncbi:MAG: hypothetical protein ACREIS_07020 [Nitrospiraceae bacterium]
MGVSAWDLVVGFAAIEGRSNDLFELEHPGTNSMREAVSNLLTGARKLVEGGEGIADHGLEVERAGRLIQGPERFRTVGIELEELVGVRLRKVRRWDGDVIESAQKGERIQPRHLQAGAQILGNER